MLILTNEINKLNLKNKVIKKLKIKYIMKNFFDEIPFFKGGIYVPNSKEKPLLTVEYF